MGIDQSLFRQVMSHFPSGVTVVTTTLHGQHAGLTVSSFASLSLEPMLVLICIDKRAISHDVIVKAGMYAVSILNEDQEYLSRRFATNDAEKFLPGTYTLSPRGLPLINGALATIECRVVSAPDGGDHTIFIGEIVDAHVGKGRPLLYYRSGYYQLG